MIIEIISIALFAVGVILLGRWVYSAVKNRVREPAPIDEFTLDAMRDRRSRRRARLYLGGGFLGIGLSLFLAGLVLQL